MLHVPFTKLPQPPKVREAVDRVLTSGRFVDGDETRRFQEDWAGICGANYCVATSSGGAALEAVLSAISLPMGVKVLVPALSYVASSFAVARTGLTPVFVDVNKRGLIDPEQVAVALKEHPDIQAVIAVHLYGQLADMDGLLEVVPEDIWLIEDAAQAHGVLSKVAGDVACFSFYPSKNLGTVGEGGAVVCNTWSLTQGVEQIVNYGQSSLCKQKNVHTAIGSNLRMSEIQAAVLRAKLPYLGGWNAERRNIADKYIASGLPSIAKEKSSWHLFPVWVPNASETRIKMHRLNIDVGVHYPYTLPPHHGDKVLYRNAESIAAQHMTLPIGPEFTEEEIDQVIAVFKEVAGDPQHYD
jgi:dTDP-4-amino-4,6-dideoxygalactose transaminase